MPTTVVGRSVHRCSRPVARSSRVTPSRRDGCPSASLAGVRLLRFAGGRTGAPLGLAGLGWRALGVTRALGVAFPGLDDDFAANPMERGYWARRRCAVTGDFTNTLTIGEITPGDN